MLEQPIPTKTNDTLTKKLRPWKLLSSQERFSAPPWVKIHVDKVKLPSGRIVDDYYRIQLPEYVMIYAQRDEDNKILLERQYKHALGFVSLILPTGCLEEWETPIEAGKRELLEETGYSAREWRFVGSFLVDGNKGCGRAHFFIARGLEKVADQVKDDMEESEIVFIEPDVLIKAVLRGEIPLLATAALIAIATHQKLLQTV